MVVVMVFMLFVHVFVFVCVCTSSKKHSSLPLDCGVDSRKQQDHDESTFRRDARRRNCRVDPTQDSNDERFSRTAAEMRYNARL